MTGDSICAAVGKSSPMPVEAFQCCDSFGVTHTPIISLAHALGAQQTHWFLKMYLCDISCHHLAV